jgi:hypothetical protein
MSDHSAKLQFGQEAKAAVREAPRCGNCRQFYDGAAELDSQFPQLRTLGSVYGSVRGSDGLCQQHGRYLRASSHCDSHEPRRERASATPSGIEAV